MIKNIVENGFMKQFGVCMKCPLKESGQCKKLGRADCERVKTGDQQPVLDLRLIDTIKR